MSSFSLFRHFLDLLLLLFTLPSVDFVEEDACGRERGWDALSAALSALPGDWLQ